MILALGIFFVFLILLLLVSACVAAISEICSSISNYNRQRWLSSKTKQIRIKDAIGVVTRRRYHASQYDVTVRIGKKTFFTTDDETAYYALRRGENVSVRVREHIDANGKVFYRALIGINLIVS